MGARPSSFKKGGGFLNNVDATIADYEFTDVFPFGDGNKKESKSDFNPLYFVLSVDVDGNEKTQQTTMFVGSADDFEISKDGKTLTPVDDGVGLREGSEFSHFIATLVASGFAETNLPDDDEPINYESIIGVRVRLQQEADQVAMDKAAKNYRKSNGKINEKGQKLSKKDGKFYNQTRLIVTAVYEASPTTSKSSPAAKDGKASKSNKAKGNDIDAVAKETLLAILADSDGRVMKAKLLAKVQTKIGSKHPQGTEIRNRIFSDDFLKLEDGWTYDAKSKNQVIEVAEEADAE